MKIKRTDTVMVITGKDAGKTGKVLRVLPKHNQVLVEGINQYKRHVKKQANQEGGIVAIERPLHVSNVKTVTESKKPQTTKKGNK